MAGKAFAFFILNNMAVFQRLSSAIYNDIVAGLKGYSSTQNMSIEQLEDDIIDERLQIIKEYTLKGVIPKRDLMLSINCIDVDCESLERCRCNLQDDCTELVAHFEIPQLLGDWGIEGIDYIGSTDRRIPFIIYTSPQNWRYHKYRKRARNRPYVFIDMTPNENNMYDCFLFNAPLVKQVSVVGIFKDPRQLLENGCCSEEDIDNFSFINNEIKRRLTEKKIRYYRQLAQPQPINDQVPR